MCPTLGISIGFLISPVYMRIQALTLPCISFLNFFLPRHLKKSVCCLFWLFYLLPQVAAANTFAFKCFWQTLPRKPPQPWGYFKSDKTKASPCINLLGRPQIVQNTQLQLLEKSSFLLPLALAPASRVQAAIFMAAIDLGEEGWLVGNLKYHRILLLQYISFFLH